MDDLKVPPHSIDAEQSVLGGLLLNNDAWIDIEDIIIVEDFYRHDHRLIYSTIGIMIQNNQACDVITLTDYLKQNSKMDEAGGFAYIGDLANNISSAANIKAYAKIVREHSVRRQLISIGTSIAETAFVPEGKDSDELLEEAEKKVYEIADKGSSSETTFQHIKDLLALNVDRIKKLYDNGDAFSGLPTTFTDLDKLTSGLQPADLIIVAGRPSMGKTTFAMNIVENVALSSQCGVAVFSMEMPAESLTLRMLSSIGRIDQSKIRSGKLDQDDFPRLTSAMSLLKEAKINIDDTPALTPTQMKARIRRLKREQPVDLIVVDYLQLMQSDRRMENKVNEISEISRGLKALAKEMHVPVIALSQLNRAVDQRTDKRPVLSDLRESGAIEQDADLILFIFREEVYNKETERKGIAEVIIGKQRNGPLGIVELTFLGQFTRFENCANKNYEQYN